MRKLYLIILAIFFSACGGGGGTTTNPSNPTEPQSTIDDPYFYTQWNLEYNATYGEDFSIDSEASISGSSTLRTYTGKGVKITVIDDGVDLNHEDLVGSIDSKYDLASGTQTVGHSSSSDYHGTAVAGIIGANANNVGIRGVAPESELVIIKYKSVMSDSETISLFNKAVELGADIINCSWGTGNVSPAVRSAIQEIANNGRDGKGTFIVFASGNNNWYMGNDESAIPEVVAVGATDRTGLRSSFSNYGPYLDLVAPGGDYGLGIPTLDPMGSAGSDNIDGYKHQIGTSFSTPTVAGAIALALEANPDLTLEEFIQYLNETSDKVGSMLYQDGRNNYYGYGKLNLDNLMKKVAP